MKESGQIFILAVVVISLILTNVVILIGSSLLFNQNSFFSTSSVQAADLAEAGIDKAVASLNVSGGSYSGEDEVFIGAGSYTVSVSSINSSTLMIQSNGYVPNASHPIAKRTAKVEVSKGSGISFVYGLLTGNGGINMGNGSTINGSVYSNGNINAGNNETFTGDVWVAGGTQTNADQQSDCTNLNCSDLFFGKSVNGSSQLDAAQSFKPSATASLNKVSLKLKKIGLPANTTVYILADSFGTPSKTVLTSGVLTTDLVSDQYNFIDVTFSSNPVLNANTVYWIMIAAPSIDNSNYLSWSEDTLGGYTNGSATYSDDWQAKKPSWTGISSDLGFKTWMSGVQTSVSMQNGSVVGGNVHAHTINGLVINKDAFYQTINNTTVKGKSFPGSADPPEVALPISSANISDWQTQAQQAGISNGDINGCPSKIGPGKIVGNITTSSNCTIDVITPVWLTGNLSVDNSTILKLDPGLGSSSGVIIVDGVTSFQNGDDLKGTGIAGSYLTLLSTNNSQTVAAINTGNSSITGILYAPFGILSLANNATFKEAVARQINMGNNTTLTYDSGLINTFFSSGPGGSYTIVKGSYQLK